jgi:hypothetical protein
MPVQGQALPTHRAVALSPGALSELLAIRLVVPTPRKANSCRRGWGAADGSEGSQKSLVLSSPRHGGVPASCGSRCRCKAAAAPQRGREAAQRQAPPQQRQAPPQLRQAPPQQRRAPPSKGRLPPSRGRLAPSGGGLPPSPNLEGEVEDGGVGPKRRQLNGRHAADACCMTARSAGAPSGRPLGHADAAAPLHQAAVHGQAGRSPAWKACRRRHGRTSTFLALPPCFLSYLRR